MHAKHKKYYQLIFVLDDLFIFVPLLELWAKTGYLCKLKPDAAKKHQSPTYARI